MNISYNVYSLLWKILTKGIIMKKVILLGALSVFLCSATGYASGKDKILRRLEFHRGVDAEAKAQRERTKELERRLQTKLQERRRAAAEEEEEAAPSSPEAAAAPATTKQKKPSIGEKAAVKKREERRRKAEAEARIAAAAEEERLTEAKQEFMKANARWVEARDQTFRAEAEWNDERYAFTRDTVARMDLATAKESRKQAKEQEKKAYEELQDKYQSMLAQEKEAAQTAPAEEEAAAPSSPKAAAEKLEAKLQEANDKVAYVQAAILQAAEEKAQLEAKLQEANEKFELLDAQVEKNRAEGTASKTLEAQAVDAHKIMSDAHIAWYTLPVVQSMAATHRRDKDGDPYYAEWKYLEDQLQDANEERDNANAELLRVQKAQAAQAEAAAAQPRKEEAPKAAPARVPAEEGELRKSSSAHFPQPEGDGNFSSY